MVEKDEKPEEETPGILIFTVAFNVKEKSITFVGNMSAVQAGGFIQQVLQVQMREQIRGEIETEIKKTTKGGEK